MICDILFGWVLDKHMLARGLRVASSRRLVLAALTVRIFLSARMTWMDVAAFALLLIGPDLAHAVSKAPEAALAAIGNLVGTISSRIRGVDVTDPEQVVPDGVGVEQA